MGDVFGLFTVSHGVKWALARRRAATMTSLVALAVGAAAVIGIERAAGGEAVEI
ncbi:hypothetical protein [Halolamina sp. CBA1230]|uniref:hypothetical protein n=1 Tax=Halolamina sp. CBA1230 TaxID=1853690 RepID=UPI0020D1924F|nr:hypothetical protein [Halolamina sp. CBA1230]